MLMAIVSLILGRDVIILSFLASPQYLADHQIAPTSDGCRLVCFSLYDSSVLCDMQ